MKATPGYGEARAESRTEIPKVVVRGIGRGSKRQPREHSTKEDNESATLRAGEEGINSSLQSIGHSLTTADEYTSEEDGCGEAQCDNRMRVDQELDEESSRMDHFQEERAATNQGERKRDVRIGTVADALTHYRHFLGPELGTAQP